MKRGIAGFFIDHGYSSYLCYLLIVDMLINFAHLNMRQGICPTRHLVSLEVAGRLGSEEYVFSSLSLSLLYYISSIVR